MATAGSGGMKFVNARDGGVVASQRPAGQRLELVSLYGVHGAINGDRSEAGTGKPRLRRLRRAIDGWTYCR